MQQYFIDTILEIDKLVPLSKDQHHHIANVMKMQETAKIRIVDFNSRIFLCEVTYIDKQTFARVLSEIFENHELPIKVTLFIALIKNDKWDIMLQKACELGVYKIVPFESSRTVVKINSKLDKKMIRWQKILQEASEQCHRNIVPIIEKPILLKDIVKFQDDLNFVAYANLDNQLLFSKVIESNKNINLVIGPEGGLSAAEVAFLNEHNYRSVKLGNRILRAETASIYALSCVSSILE